jgi:DNA-binding transcriptional ArsR family regulator
MERLFLALCDKTRIKLIGLMSDGEVSVNYLCDALGESQPKVSRHLAYLRSTGIVSTKRDGKRIYYSLSWPTDPSGIRCFAEILNWINLSISHRLSILPISRSEAEETSEPENKRDDQTYENANMLDREQEDMDVYLL